MIYAANAVANGRILERVEFWREKMGPDWYVVAVPVSMIQKRRKWDRESKARRRLAARRAAAEAGVVQR